MNRPTFEQLEPLFERFPTISIINLVGCLGRALKNGDRIAIDTFESMIEREVDKLVEQGWTKLQLKTAFFTHSPLGYNPTRGMT